MGPEGMKAKLKDVISLGARYTRGEAWARAPYCEAFPVSGNEPGGAFPAKRNRFTGKDRAFNGYSSVGAISAIAAGGRGVITPA